MLWISDSKAQKLVAVLEDLGGEHTNYVAVGCLVLKRELSPGQYIRLEVRTVKRRRFRQVSIMAVPGLRGVRRVWKRGGGMPSLFLLVRRPPNATVVALRPCKRRANGPRFQTLPRWSASSSAEDSLPRWPDGSAGFGAIPPR